MYNMTLNLSANLENSAVAQDQKRSLFIPNPNKGNAKECSNYCTVEFISHASKVMHKILQVRLQQCVNQELPDIQVGFKKGRGMRNQNYQHLLDHRKNKGISKKTIYFCFIDCVKAFDYVDHNKLWKILKEMGIPSHLTCLLRNLYAGQEATVRTGHGTTDCLKLGKEYVKTMYCHPVNLAYMHNTSCEMSGWMNQKLESRLPAEI